MTSERGAEETEIVTDESDETMDSNGFNDPSSNRPLAAVFRPADERLSAAVDQLESLGMTPVADPMLAIEPTGYTPRSDAAITVLTSKTGATLVTDRGWEPGPTTLCAIGPKTAEALEARGFDVDLVPSEYTSSGLVDCLTDRVDGARVEIARSDHGSDVLIDGLVSAGAYVHETVLYRLERPAGSGDSMELAARGQLDAACFTSSLTVEHALDAARERGIESETIIGLNDAVVGVIGEPTRETARTQGLEVDVVASNATAETLISEVCEHLSRAR